MNKEGELSAARAAEFTLPDALRQPWDCCCGKTHRTNLQWFRVQPDVLQDLTDILRQADCRRVLLVADTHTYAVQGQAAADVLQACCPDLLLEQFIFPDPELVPDEQALKRLQDWRRAIPVQTGDYWLAVGSGTLNDLTRYVSSQENRPYLVLGTAPSMDGYASGVSPLIIRRMKQTFPAQSPQAVLADPRVLARAPRDLILAGIGDVLGKYNSLLDWQLSVLVNDEYDCPFIRGLVEKSRDEVARLAPKIIRGDEAAVSALMTALTEVGVAMDYSDSSRPASGAEHHLAHFWEMRELLSGNHGHYHGTEVGLALPLILSLWRQLAGWPEPLEKCSRPARSSQAWQRQRTRQLEEAYRQAAPSVLKFDQEVDWFNESKRQQRLARIRAVWPRIRQLAQTAPDPETLTSLYRQIGFPLTPADIGLTPDDVQAALNHASALRDRYTILRLLDDLNWSPAELL
ncbi:sn-glycerol-1-phosphate dehydrogenase [Oscillospiraceae bacterium HV4-5-C5C]|nr:sn-glycerol-1-phosphate dehydrogenase [Oscillospiraceae bacterium HV4-5-C5C]